MSAAAAIAAAPADPLLSVEGIHTYYGKSHILNGVSLSVGRGEVVGLLGRNGVGKSTTLKAIAGLVRVSQGAVRFDGRAITALPAHRLARLGIGYVPEDRRIFPLLTVMENLRTGLDRHGVSKARKAELVDKLFAFFPRLAERRNQLGGTLSGGEQQMLAIARAMMLEPKIILLDEPTEGLMPRMVSQIREIIAALHADGVAVLLVEQNVPLTLEAGERIYFIEKGEVRHHARAADLRVDDPVIHRYLGV
jgi:branched-chain amino acid transport system ATP-binding protein